MLMLDGILPMPRALQVVPGSLFVCERGAEFDGHDFVDEVGCSPLVQPVKP